MDGGDALHADIRIPFPSKRIAEIVYHVLRVDAEPKRSCISKEMSVEENVLVVKFEGKQTKNLRVALTSFFESVHLVTETIQFAGAPVSEKYEHF